LPENRIDPKNLTGSSLQGWFIDDSNVVILQYLCLRHDGGVQKGYYDQAG
jgi:hypothetical protein